jgi:hypothetical protein
MSYVEVGLGKGRTSSKVTPMIKDLRSNTRLAVYRRRHRRARRYCLEGREFGRVRPAFHPVKDIGTVNIKYVRPVSR